MDVFNYLVYDGDVLIAGFVSFCAAVSFAEKLEHPNADRGIPVDLVDPVTGAVIDRWLYGEWRYGKVR